jgi:hypothetical protein
MAADADVSGIAGIEIVGLEDTVSGGRAVTIDAILKKDPWRMATRPP